MNYIEDALMSYAYTIAARRFFLLTAAFFVSAVPAAASDIPLSGEFASDSTIADNELDQNRGEGIDPGTITISSTENATSTGNSVDNSPSGSNTVATDALTNVTGFTTLIMNTGPNALIQSSFTANITFNPAAAPAGP